MWTKILFCVLASVAFANAETNKSPGPCPDIPAQENIDDVKFADGPWYLVSISGDKDGYKCIRTVTTLTPKKTFHVTGVNKDGPVDKTVDFETVSPGVFKIVGDDDWAGESTVISTDVDNYFVGYSCKHDSSDDTHEQKVYIDVREKHMKDPSAMIAKAQTAIEERGIKVTKYYSVDQTDCAKR